MDENFVNYLLDNNNWDGFSNFGEISEDSVESIANDKPITDSIPINFFKCILPSIIIPMTHITNKSLTSGIMPKSCKKGLITPIYKGEGDKLDPGNYRPISILPLLGKCIEFFVNQNLTNYITKNNILNSRQFGFRKDNSTTYLMLELFDKIYSSKEKGNKPAVVFLDIKSYFIDKTTSMGINGQGS